VNGAETKNGLRKTKKRLAKSQARTRGGGRDTRSQSTSSAQIGKAIDFSNVMWGDLSKKQYVKTEGKRELYSPSRADGNRGETIVLSPKNGAKRDSIESERGEPNPLSYW